MAKIPNFLGGSAPAASVNLACDRTVNLFPEALDGAGADKAPGMLRGCPGLATALLTLPTSPLRCLTSGGAPLTTGGRLFAVAGSHAYEIFAGGTYTDLGDVGNNGKPAQMFLNGSQLWIVSNDQTYLHDGTTLSQPQYIGYNSTVSTSGTSVTWIAGSQFDAGLHNQTVYISASPYTAHFVDETHLTLTSSAGTQASVPLLAYVSAGTGDLWYNKFRRQTGPLFTSALVGQTFLVNGTSFTVASVEDSNNITFSGPIGIVTILGATWSTTALNIVTARTGAYLRGYFIAAMPDAKQINVSDLYDGKTWDPLDYELKSGYPDNIGAILADKDELYVFGEMSTEVFSPNPNITADNTFPFAENEAGAMPIGIAAPFSACATRNGPIWIGCDLRGQPVVYRAQGFTPVRVSTHAVETAWSQYSTIADAEAFMYELEGHEFYWVSFPTAAKTWVYDVTASQQIGRPQWHERTYYDGTRHKARCHAYVWGKHWVGDYATGAIYEMSESVYQDLGHPIYCVRQFEHLSADRLRQFFSRLQVDLETGNADVTVKLEWSNDSGHTFPSSQQITITANDAHSAPNYAARAMFRRLGSGRDRVYRLTVWGNCRIALINAYIDAVAGVS